MAQGPTDVRAWSKAAMFSLLLLVSTPLVVNAAETVASHAADETEIRAQASAYSAAFADAAVDKLMAMWTDSAIFVDEDGDIYRGRSEIKKAYDDFFAHNGNRQLDVVVESVTFPADNVAVEEGITRPKSDSGAASATRYVVTHIKSRAKWLMESVSESPYHPASLGEFLKPLSWLIGNWQVDGPNGSLKFKAEWANKNVIALNVEAKAKDQPEKSVQSEFIYWNPVDKSICSWQFNASGETSRKWWQPVADSWIIHANSTQADGTEGGAIYRFRQIDKDKFAWQSKRRRLGSTELPDTEEITVTRVKD